MTAEATNPAQSRAEPTPQPEPERRGFWQRSLQQSVFTVLFDKLLLTLVIAVATYTIQGYLEQNSQMQENLRSSIATVTGVRSEFLKQQRNTLATDIVGAVNAMDAGAAVGGLSDMRQDALGRANRIAEHFGLLSSFVLNELPVPEEGAPPSGLQLAVFELQKANIALHEAITAVETQIDDLPTQFPELAGDAQTAATSSDGLMALVEVVANGKGALIEAFVDSLGALDRVTVEQVRVDLQDAVKLARGGSIVRP